MFQKVFTTVVTLGSVASVMSESTVSTKTVKTNKGEYSLMQTRIELKDEIIEPNTPFSIVIPKTGDTKLADVACYLLHSSDSEKEVPVRGQSLRVSSKSEHAQYVISGDIGKKELNHVVDIACEATFPAVADTVGTFKLKTMESTFNIDIEDETLGKTSFLSSGSAMIGGLSFTIESMTVDSPASIMVATESANILFSVSENPTTTTCELIVDGTKHNASVVVDVDYLVVTFPPSATVAVGKKVSLNCAPESNVSAMKLYANYPALMSVRASDIDDIVVATSYVKAKMENSAVTATITLSILASLVSAMVFFM